MITRNKVLNIMMIMALLTAMMAPATASLAQEPPALGGRQEDVLTAAPLVGAELNAAPEALPHHCGFTSPACCVAGYVYYNGAPAAGAEVTIQTSSGDVTDTTGEGPASSHDYYAVDLTNAELGEVITVTASYMGLTARKVYTIVDAGQQVDVVFASDGEDISLWQTTAPLPQPRVMGNTAAVIDNYLYFVGGRDSSGGAIDTVYYTSFNPDGTLSNWMTNTVSVGSAPPYPKTTTNGEYLYFFASGSGHRDVHYAKPDVTGAIGAFTSTTSLPTLTQRYAIAATASHVYAIGGDGDYPCRYAAVNADGSLGDWVDTTAPQAMLRHEAVSCNNRIYVLGGQWEQSDVYYADINPDGSLGSWITATQPIPQGVHDFAAVADCDNNKIYVLGGKKAHSVPLDGVYYATINPADGSIVSWTTTASLPEAFGGLSAAEHDGHIYVIGGQDADAVRDDVLYASISSPAPPIATIHTITPNPATLADTITLYGSGQDQDEGGASITAYEWRVGAITRSTATATISAAELGEGEHTVYFKVQDDEGVWSEEVTGTVRIENVTNQPPTAQIISITPNPAEYAASITFTGAGDDPDGGAIADYVWRYEGGALGSGAELSISASTIGAGAHTAYLQVMDDEGGWSEEVSAPFTINESPDPGVPTCAIDYVHPNPVTQNPGELVYFREDCRDNDADEGSFRIVAYRWRSDVDGQLSTAGDFSLAATQLSAGTHTIYLMGQDDEGVWTAEANSTLVVNPVETPDYQTLILVNRAKFAELYSESEATQLTDKLNEFAALDSVQGLVMQVENTTAVADAYAAWTASNTTANANAVATAIKEQVVDAQLAAYPDIEYLVLVGDDRIIPFRRVLDQTIDPDDEDPYEYVDADSTTGYALQDYQSLTDDYYADEVPTVPRRRGWDGHDLYIPDRALGRLIETPAEIINQLDIFIAGDEVTINEAIVTGGDMRLLYDAAWAMCNTLRGDNISTDCTLISNRWSKTSFLARVFNTVHQLKSINGHADHWTWYTPYDWIETDEIAGVTADHSRVLFYTLGCHSGLNVPPTNPYESLDWPQALVQLGALYIGNTGYGWGSDEALALSEQLMLDFTEQLAYGQSAYVGKALAAAKQEYYRNSTLFDYYDEKIMIESTLYGLPMYRYVTANGTLAQQVSNSAPDSNAGVIVERTAKPLQTQRLHSALTVNSFGFQFPDFQEELTDKGTYHTLNGMAQAGKQAPIQPKFTQDTSMPGTRARGIVLTGGTYYNTASFDPVVDAPVTMTTRLADIPEPEFTAPAPYPPVFHHLNQAGTQDAMALLLGQFDPNTETERLYERLDFDVYYHPDLTDQTAPTITMQCGALAGEDLALTVQPTDTAGIAAVVVAYTAGDGAWASVELTETGALWAGSFPADANTDFFVQVVDGYGNVAVDDDAGTYYQAAEVEACAAQEYRIYLPVLMKNLAAR